jgi:hypothetical protein
VNEQQPAGTGRHVLHTTAADMSTVHVGGSSLWANSFVRGVAPKKSD